MTYIDELRDVIRKLHGVESKHVERVPVKETFRGRTVGDGVVEVFELIGHPSATLSIHGGTVTILQTDPIISPLLAVRAVIVQEFRGNAPAEA